MRASLDAESRSLVQETLTRFVDDMYQPHPRLLRLKAGSVDVRAHWPLLAELGILAMPQSEEQGGMGAGARDIAHAVRTLARGLVLEPVIEAVVIAGAILALVDDASEREQAVEALISGRRISVVVGLLPHTALPQAHCEGGTIELRGRACAVPYADEADEWLVVVRDAHTQELLVLRVPRSQTDVELIPLRMMDAHPAADLCFDGVRLNQSNILIRGANAEAAMTRAQDLALVAYAADALGAIEQLVSLTGEYLRTRIQFGTPIGSFQALQHRYADMHMDMLEARALVNAFAAALDREDDAADALAQTAALASAVARLLPRAGKRVAHEAIQMHGGMGVTEELVVSHYNARLQVLGGFLQFWRALPAIPFTEAV